MNKLNKGSIIVAVIGLLLFIVYALAIYLFSGLFTSVAIVSFVFAVIAFVLAFTIPRIAIRNSDVEAVFFGIPMISFGIYYFIAEIFVSAIFIGFQNHLPFEIVLFVQVVLLVAFVIISIVSFTAQKASSQQSQERRQEATVWNMQTVDIQSLVDSCRANSQDQNLGRALEHLSETIRYSDPFSGGNPAIAEIENRIAGKTSDLQMVCNSGDAASAMALVQELENLYKERSRKMLLIK